MTNVRDAARRLRERGQWAIPIPKGTKAPVLDKWQQSRFTMDELSRHFNEGHNIGVLLGVGNPPWVDVDLDCTEAIRLAPHLLEPTGLIFGRAGKLHSHRIYIASVKSELFKDVDGTMILELRSTGHQTVFPPSVHPSGERVTSEEDGEPASIEAETLQRGVAELATAALLARHWPVKGSRDETAMALAGVLLRGGWDVERTREFIELVSTTAEDEEAAARATKAEATAKKLAAGLPITGWPHLADLVGKDVAERARFWLGLGEIGTSEKYTYDEVGNAQHLHDRNGFEIRFTPGHGWLIWDGQRWSTTLAEGVVTRRVHAMTADMLADANRQTDKDKAKALRNWARTSRSHSRINGTMKQLSKLKGIEMRDDVFDAHPTLLNCLNGTLDLNSGELREHRPDDYLTQLTAAPYLPESRSSRWHKLLQDSTGGDVDLIAYVQRAVGYSLSGDMREEKIFFVYGPPQSGKSTLLTAVYRTMGGYAQNARFETFLASRADGSSASPQLARMRGVRFITAVESGEGRKLAAGLLKQLVGGDPMTARNLYRDLFEFMPTAKIWLGSNERSHANYEDDAFWRRLREIPFDHPVPDEQRDDDLKDELIDPLRSGAAILAWSVEGYRLWRRDGLREPAAIIKASQEYRADMDKFQDWFDACCDRTSDAEPTEFGPLHRSLNAWTKQQGWRPLSAKWLAKQLTKHGYPGDDEKRGGWRRGLCLKEPEAAKEPEF